MNFENFFGAICYNAMLKGRDGNQTLVEDYLFQILRHALKLVRDRRTLYAFLNKKEGNIRLGDVVILKDPAWPTLYGNLGVVTGRNFRGYQAKHPQYFWYISLSNTGGSWFHQKNFEIIDHDDDLLLRRDRILTQEQILGHAPIERVYW